MTQRFSFYTSGIYLVSFLFIFSIVMTARGQGQSLSSKEKQSYPVVSVKPAVQTKSTTNQEPQELKSKANSINQESGKASATATYANGNISCDAGFTNFSQSSSCPGQLIVSIPANAEIISVDVSYTMTATWIGSRDDQRSQLRCTSSGGTNEMSLAVGVGSGSGSYNYNRTGLNIANSVSGGGNIVFELHAGHSSWAQGCTEWINRVDNNTWTITVYYTLDPVPDFTASLTTVDVGQSIVFTDNTTGPVTSWNWNFGAGATPATANTQGPHTVSYSTAGLKTVNLTVNGSFTETKTDYITANTVYSSVTATYTVEDLSTDFGFQSLPGASTCPGTLTVTIPANVNISGVDVAYDIRTRNNGWKSEQRSQLRCISSGGTSEPSLILGTGNQTGTQSYSRTGLTIANGVSGGGNIQFQLHAGRTYGGSGCNTTYNYVRINTWTITVHYTTDPVPNFAANNTTTGIGQTIIFTDITMGNPSSYAWDFGTGASPPIASSQGPHAVSYSTSGYKTVSLTVNGSLTKTKADYLFVIDPNDWLKWDDNVNTSQVGGINTTWQVAARFQPADFAGYGAAEITLVKVYMGDLPTSTTLKIWQGASQTSLVEEVSQVINPTADSWNTIALSIPYTVNSSEELWIGLELGNPNSNYNVGIDALTSADGKSNLYRTDVSDPNAWNTLTSANIDGDWNIQARLVPTGSWIGVVSSAWENHNNWFSSTVPITTTNVSIPQTPHDPLITSEVVINNLVIDAGASLTVSPDYSLTVNGSLINNAGTSGLVIQSGILGTGSFISSTSGIAGTFERYVKGDPEAWHGLSSPMVAQEISGSFTPSGTYGDSTGYDFYTWYEPDTSWIYRLNTLYPPTWLDANGNNNFLQGRGYLASYQATNPTLIYEGTFASGNITVPVTLSTGVADEFGSNLLGNPYPSSIDWKAANGWTRNALDFTGVGYNVWIWNDTANNYGVYNTASVSDLGTLGVSRYIPPTQGFFVLAAQTGSVGMTNEVRVHNEASNWLKSKGEKPELFYMSVISMDGYGDDEIMLEVNADDKREGSYKRFSFVPTAPGLWMPQKGKTYSSLMLESFTKEPVIPLAFKAGESGSYVINTWFEEKSLETAILLDLQTGLSHDLKEQKEISILASPTDNPGRFVLQFVPGNYPNPHDPIPVRIYTFNQTLYLDLRLINKDEPCRITLINTAGMRVYDQQYDGGEAYQISFPNLQGMFIATVSNSAGRSTQKVAF